MKWSPRVGAVYSLNTKTVLRGGYGIYWAPWNYPVPSSVTSNYGQIGFTQNTVSPQTAGTPTVSLTNPFPNGLVAPRGNSLGALSGVGTTISFVDQNRTAPRVQQYSADLQRELPGAMAVTISYVGARGDHLPLGGTDDTVVNINQLDPKYLALGSTVLNQAVPNPFFGNAAAGPLASQATLTRGQLLRPYPQFLNVQARQVSEGVNRYNAAVIEWSKRPTQGRHRRPRQLHLQRAEGQPDRRDQLLHQPRQRRAGEQLQLHRVDAGVHDDQLRRLLQPARRLRLRHPRRPAPRDHRADLAAAVRQGSPVGDQRSRRTRSPAAGRSSAVVNLQSGFPIGLTQTDNTLLGGANRPNLTGAGFETPGDFADRLASADHPTATWLNPAAITAAPAGTFGNAPRTITDVRTPPIKNTDLSFSKSFGLSGGKSAQIKFEIINLFNRVQTDTADFDVTAGSSTFGQITHAVRVHAAHAGDVPLHVLTGSDPKFGSDPVDQRGNRGTRREGPFLCGFYGPG